MNIRIIDEVVTTLPVDPSRAKIGYVQPMAPFLLLAALVGLFLCGLIYALIKKTGTAKISKKELMKAWNAGRYAHPDAINPYDEEAYRHVNVVEEVLQ